MADGDGKVSIELKDATILRLEPGDVVVFKFGHELTSEDAAKAQAYLKSLMPPWVQILIADCNTEVSVLRPAADPFQTL